jgi:hypothetical protein
MTKFEKRLCIFAIVFVTIYLGTIVITIHSRVSNEKKVARIESVEAAPGEGQMMLAELLLPMLIFLSLTVCFIIVKKKRANAAHAHEDSDEEFP